jgi:hypothetical protein
MDGLKEAMNTELRVEKVTLKMTARAHTME